MAEALGRTLYLLIRAGKLAPVEEFLTENVIPTGLRCEFPDVLKRVVTGSGKSAVESYTCMDASADFNDCWISPLFPAILRVWRNKDEIHQAKESIRILKCLLRHGFPANVVGSFRVTNVGTWNHLSKDNETPILFAMWLNLEINHTPSAALNEVVQLLKEARTSVVQPMASVPTTTKLFWKSLLFSEASSDVRFRCTGADGQKVAELVPAMKGILVAASEFFRAQLSGAWSDTHADGVIDTNLSSPIIKAILTYIYCGALDPMLLESQTSSLLRASCEYMLPDLKRICEGQLSKKLTKEVIRDALITAHLHSCEVLLTACHKLLRANPSIPFLPSFMSLASDYPDLWRSLTVSLGGQPEDAADDAANEEGKAEEGKDEAGVAVGDKRKR